MAGRLLLGQLTVLLGGLLAATLAHMAPGFGIDERELDGRRSEASLQELRQSRAAQGDILAFCQGYLAGLFHGDLGVSPSLQRPVRELLAERLPVTLRGVGLGLACGWFLALSLAGPAALSRAPFFDLFGSALSGVFLCLPSALLALLLLLAGGPGPLAIGFVVFPRVFRYTRNLLLQTRDLPHVLMARAKGAGRARILFCHVTPPAASQLLALAGVSVSTALGAAIPVEVLCDMPGAGQLAWLAALGRDLPLLVNLTALATAATLIANSVSDLAAARLAERPADI
jgi:peptide/nickel transport system permease protein